MKLTRSKKMFLIIALTAFVVLLFSSNTAFGAINGEYSTVDTVSDNYLDDAFNDSSLLGLLAKLVFAVGRFLEWILGMIFKMLSGSADFPWADKIVFNAVPLLDVNFINPDLQSFVGNESIQAVLKNLYSTILTLAVTFFGIVVLITSIKLVITTIASEKAKYKQAIVDWLIGFVMLFCIHYAISFIFYLNEQLVVVASKIVTAQLERYEVKAQAQVSALGNQLIDRMGGTVYNGTYKGQSNVPIKQILQENTNVLGVYMNLDSSDDSDGLHEFLMKEIGILGWDQAVWNPSQKQKLAAIIAWAAEVNVSVSELENIRKYRVYPVSITGIGAQVITESDFDTIFDNHSSEFSGFGDNAPLTIKVAKWQCALQTANYNIDEINTNWSNIDSTEMFYASKGFKNVGSHNNWISGLLDTLTGEVHATYDWDLVLKDLIRVKGASATNSCSDRDTGSKKDRCESIENGTIAASGRSQRIIADLATYFKENARAKEFRTTNNTGLKDTGAISIQNMIMYAILVAQSLILFIAYIKRLFYVIILAMMAPVVVVFDFFQKFGK